MNVIRLAFCCLLCYVFVPGQLHAQSVNTQERILVHLDKAFYVGGEVIWHKIYLPQKFQGHEIGLKVALRDRSGQSVGDYFIRTYGGTAVDGFFKLPYGLEAGMYHLMIIGIDSKTKVLIKLAETFVPVYDDLNEELDNLNVVEVQPQPDPAVYDLQVAVNLEGTTFRKREEIKALVAVSDRAGRPVEAELSVAVIDSKLAAGENRQANILMAGTFEVGYDPADLDNRLYIHGKISKIEGPPRPDVLFGAYASQEQTCYFTTSGPSGEFALELPAFSGEKTIQFTALRDNSLQARLSDDILLSKAPPLIFTEEIKQYLEWSRSRKMIYQLYNSVEAGLQLKTEPVVPKELVPDQRVVLKQYASFPDLYTFFLEVSTPLKIRQDKDKGYYAMMFNPDPKMRAFYQGNPIIILDGKITKDINFLQQLDLEKIDTIDLYFDNTKLINYFGKMGNSGVAVFKTSIPNLRVPASDEANIFSVNGFLPEVQPLALEDPRPDQPIFKPQLFWSPDFFTDANGQVSFSFPQTDDLGTFRIEVVARAKDGKMGYARKTYQVQW